MTTLAVVPIFITAGTAVLPTILAAIASVGAIILRPRELLRLCRRRPIAAGGWAGGIALAVAATVWLLSPGAAPRANANQPNHRDWAKIAEDMLALESAVDLPTTRTSENDTAQSAPLVEGRDFSRSSYSGGPSPMKLKPLWHFRPEDTIFLSEPAVTPNRVYTAACQADLGSYTGLLACLDPDTGTPIWQTTLMGDDTLKPFFSSPAITADGKSLIIGQGLHMDHDCSLLCFDTTNGKPRWHVPVSLHIESSPAIAGDLAVVGAGAIEGPDGKATGDPGFVLAVRISDGKEMWRYPVNDPESSPAIDDSGAVLIGSGFNGCAIIALRSQSEEELKAKNLDRLIWRRPVALPVTCSITLAGDLAIAGAGNGDVVHSNENARGLVIAVDRHTGEVRWQTPLGDSVLGIVAARDGLAICPVRNGQVFALSLADGKIVWRQSISGSAPVIAGCAFTGKRVYAVSSDGYLAILDAKNGAVLEKLYLNDQAKPGTGLTMSPPQVAGGRVIVGSETGGLHCLAGAEAVP
jgi:outer membrane protein assembly factor BamB